jgi:lipoate-protein ligase A
LSLGYFQHLDDRRQHAPSRECDLVRRASGGGAILHDQELTYSLTLAVGRHVDADLQTFYRTLHQTLIDTLSDFGVTARLCENPSRRERHAEPFLCFQRRSEGDVLIGDHKIAGSAQRRYRTVLLQHGSILLERSDHAPELPGIAQLTGVTLSAGELSERWRERIARELDWTLRPEGLREREVALATQRVQTRYAHDAWTARR